MLHAQRWVIGAKVKEIAKDGFERDQSLGNAFIDMYAKGASLTLSRVVFDGIFMFATFKIKIYCHGIYLYQGMWNMDLICGYAKYGMLVWLC